MDSKLLIINLNVLRLITDPNSPSSQVFFPGSVEALDLHKSLGYKLIGICTDSLPEALRSMTLHIGHLMNITSLDQVLYCPDEGYSCIRVYRKYNSEKISVFCHRSEFTLYKLPDLGMWYLIRELFSIENTLLSTAAITFVGMSTEEEVFCKKAEIFFYHGSFFRRDQGIKSRPSITT